VVAIRGKAPKKDPATPEASLSSQFKEINKPQILAVIKAMDTIIRDTQLKQGKACKINLSIRLSLRTSSQFNKC